MPESSRTDAFLELYAAAQRRVYAYIRTQVLSSADADDVMQDATTVLWRKFDQYQPGTDFVRWACRVAARGPRLPSPSPEAADYLQRRGGRTPSPKGYRAKRRPPRPAPRSSTIACNCFPRATATS